MLAITPVFAEDSHQLVLRAPTYSVGGMRLGEKVNLDPSYRCRPSDQFASFDWCAAQSQERDPRGKYEQTTTMLRADNGRVFYLNRLLKPAFFAPKEIENDIAQLNTKFGSQAALFTLPSRGAGPKAVIAMWGGLTLVPLSSEQKSPLTLGQSPKVGLLVDYLNDFVSSAKNDFPIYKLDGTSGFIYNATLGTHGKGRLRFLAANPSALGRDATGQAVATSGEETSTEPKDAEAESDVSGSGFYVSAMGHVLTNAHVVEGCRSITISQRGEPPTEGRIVAKDSLNDLALIQAKDHQQNSVPPLRGNVRLGEQVAVFGFPLNGILATTGNFTLGNVTATAGLQDDSRILQISSPVQPGNSGGPLLDQNGNVVGVVVAKLDALRFASITHDVAQNINFAIKATVAQTFLEANGISNASSSSSIHLEPDSIAEKAKSFTVFVECKRTSKS
jgi:S1-C subfamily serine protease